MAAPPEPKRADVETADERYKPLTTGDIARYCHVSHVAVWKWIKKGRLKAWRLPGGHYRVERDVFKAFLLAHDMPLDRGVFGSDTRRILVIDDEFSILEIASRALQQLGDDVTVATASDGFEAGLQVATFKPDLLLLDLMMPRMNGFEVCRLVRKNPATAHTKILVITAFGSHENLQRALEAGADDFMHKPVDLEQLKAKVQTLLGG